MFIKCQLIGQANRFLSVHAAFFNLVNSKRDLVRAGHSRLLRNSAFASWESVTAKQDGIQSAFFKDHESYFDVTIRIAE